MAVTTWFFSFSFHFLSLLTTFTFLDSRLKGSVSGVNFAFIFDIGGCQRESESEWLAELTFRPLHPHIPCFFYIFVSGFYSVLLERHPSRFLRDNRMV